MSEKLAVAGIDLVSQLKVVKKEDLLELAEEGKIPINTLMTLHAHAKANHG
jgi:hypothetical protein